MADGDVRALERKGLDHRWFCGVPQREVWHECTEARFQSKARHPQHITSARIRIKECSMPTVWTLEAAQRFHELMMQFDER